MYCSLHRGLLVCVFACRAGYFKTIIIINNKRNSRHGYKKFNSKHLKCRSERTLFGVKKCRFYSKERENLINRNYEEVLRVAYSSTWQFTELENSLKHRISTAIAVDMRSRNALSHLKYSITSIYIDLIRNCIQQTRPYSCEILILICRYNKYYS